MSWVRKRDETTEHGYVEERLSAYLDGELTQQEQGIVERHLATCQDCRWNLDTLRQTVQWVQELPSVPVPRVFTIPVAAQPARAPRRRWGVPLLQGATALVALMLVFVVAGDFVLTGSWFPAASEVGLPLAAPGAREAVPTVSAEADAALQAVVETVEVEATILVEQEVEKVVEEAAVEEAPPPATVLESPAPEVAAAESPPPERAEPPAPAAVPSFIADRESEAQATPEAPGGEGTTIVEAQTAIARVQEEQAATVGAEPSGTPTPEPTVLPTETSAPPPLPTPTVIPTLVPTPSPEPPLAAEAPTAVAIAPTEEPPAGVREGVRTEDWVEPPAPAATYHEPEAARLPRDPLIVWFGVTEISLAAVFVMLATITIVVMIRQRFIR